MKHTPFILAAVAVLACSTLAPAQVYIDETFDYPNGNLGSPWIVEDTSGVNTAVVGAAETLKSYTPQGKQTTFTKNNPGTPTPPAHPQIGGRLFSGENPGTVDWLLEPGDKARLTLEFNFSRLNNGNTFRFFLRGGAISFVGLQISGTGNGEAQVDYMTTSSSGSLTPLPDTPTLLIDTWYRLTLDVSIIDKKTSSYDRIVFERLGDDGGVVYDNSDGLVLNASNDFSPHASFWTTSTGGYPEWSVASIQLAVPEPTTVALLVGGLGLAGAGLLRRRR